MYIEAPLILGLSSVHAYIIAHLATIVNTLLLKSAVFVEITIGVLGVGFAARRFFEVVDEKYRNDSYRGDSFDGTDDDPALAAVGFAVDDGDYESNWAEDDGGEEGEDYEDRDDFEG